MHLPPTHPGAGRPEQEGRLLRIFADSLPGASTSGMCREGGGCMEERRDV